MCKEKGTKQTHRAKEAVGDMMGLPSGAAEYNMLTGGSQHQWDYPQVTLRTPKAVPWLPPQCRHPQTTCPSSCCDEGSLCGFLPLTYFWPVTPPEYFFHLNVLYILRGLLSTNDCVLIIYGVLI